MVDDGPRSQLIDHYNNNDTGARENLSNLTHISFDQFRLGSKNELTLIFRSAMKRKIQWFNHVKSKMKKDEYYMSIKNVYNSKITYYEKNVLLFSYFDVNFGFVFRQPKKSLIKSHDSNLS